jgi:hypothetical protein
MAIRDIRVVEIFLCVAAHSKPFHDAARAPVACRGEWHDPVQDKGSEGMVSHGRGRCDG